METEKTAILRHECTVNEKEVSACQTSFSFSEGPVVFGGIDFVSTCVTCIVRCFLSRLLQQYLLYTFSLWGLGLLALLSISFHCNQFYMQLDVLQNRSSCCFIVQCYFPSSLSFYHEMGEKRSGRKRAFSDHSFRAPHFVRLGHHVAISTAVCWCNPRDTLVFLQLLRFL